MKKIIMFAFLMSTLGLAVSYETASLLAAKYLKVDFVKLDNESRKSYFFITELEFEVDDVEEEYPCFRGVVVDKISGKVIDPSLDEEIITSFPYSDTHQEGNVIINCAD